MSKQKKDEKRVPGPVSRRSPEPENGAGLKTRRASGTRIPSYRLHKASGQAVVTLGGRDHYLGKWDTEASRAAYEAVVARWLRNGRRVEPAAEIRTGHLTVNGLVARYWEFAQTYYRRPDGSVTQEPSDIRLAMRPLCGLFGRTPAEEFGPRRLKEVREVMVQKGWCRSYVNQAIGRIKRCFKWAASEELVSPSVHHGLSSVAGLRRGRSDARETEPVRPVSEEDMRAVLPHVSEPVRAMILVQWFTGMRPGEVLRMRGCEMEMTGDTWFYRPALHKTAHHGRARVIAIGPKAQEVLRPFVRLDPQAWLFQPASAGRGGRPRPNYDAHSYRRAIVRGCKKAGICPWAANQLRHAAATRIRRRHGIDAARALLGHASPVVTEIYAELDQAAAARAVSELG